MGEAMVVCDLAKIGQLIPQRGNWNGTQIVSASWIDARSCSL
jgi:hypothetical protein